MSKISYREFLENYVDSTISIAIAITGNLPEGEQVDIEMSPDFAADMMKVFYQEGERIVQAIELEKMLKDSSGD